MQRLANDRDHWVRTAVGCNPVTPVELTEQRLIDTLALDHQGVHISELLELLESWETKMNDLMDRICELFGRGGKAYELDAPYICPFPWFVERERQLQEEEKARQAAASSSEKPQPTDEQ